MPIKDRLSGDAKTDEETPNMRIAITGASGFIGSELVEQLAFRHDIVVLGRHPERLSAQFGGRFQAFAYDAAVKAFKDVDAVIHLAAALPGTLRDAEEYAAANTVLSNELGRAALNEHVGIFVNAATLGWNQNAYASSKLAAEERLNSLIGLKVAHVRLPVVYSSEFRGRLKVLNKVPTPLRGLAFQALAALRPTVSLDRVCHSIEEVCISGEPGEVLVSDRQEGNQVYKGVRLVVDYTFALSVIFLFWWALLLIYLVVRIESRGSGIFAQQRVGKHRKLFTLYKFRTMSVGTKVAGTHEVSDSAITRVGGFLRRTKLDELPQVINILRREISLIGPRPCLPMQVELIEAREARGVYEVLPGITGRSQIDGIDMSDPQQLARSDERSIAERNLLSDLKIITQTFLGRGHGDRVARDAE